MGLLCFDFKFSFQVLVRTSCHLSLQRASQYRHTTCVIFLQGPRNKVAFLSRGEGLTKTIVMVRQMAKVIEIG